MMVRCCGEVKSENFHVLFSSPPTFGLSESRKILIAVYDPMKYKAFQERHLDIIIFPCFLCVQLAVTGVADAGEVLVGQLAVEELFKSVGSEHFHNP